MRNQRYMEVLDMKHDIDMRAVISWRRSQRLIAILAMIVCLVHCGDKIDPIQLGDGACDIADPVVYEQSIEQILSIHCVQCHSTSALGLGRSGAPTNINYDSYDSARRWADRALARISDGSMPPPGPPRVSACEVSAMSRWIELGTPQTEEDI